MKLCALGLSIWRREGVVKGVDGASSVLQTERNQFRSRSRSEAGTNDETELRRRVFEF